MKYVIKKQVAAANTHVCGSDIMKNTIINFLIERFGNLDVWIAWGEVAIAALIFAGLIGVIVYIIYKDTE